MWELPSFIAHCEKKKKYNGAKTISDKLPIEREADLRQKKKKILQRLKQNLEPEAPCDEHNSHSSSALATSDEFISRELESGVSEGEQKPRIFTRKTGARQSSDVLTQSKQSESLTLDQSEDQRKLQATNERTTKRNVSRIPVPSPSCASPPRTHIRSFHGKNVGRLTPGFENSRDCYTPSFSSESLRKSDHNKRVSMIKQTVSKRNEEIVTKKHINSRESRPDTSENSTKYNSRIVPTPLINIERTATPSRDTHESGDTSLPEKRRTPYSKQAASSTNLHTQSETGVFMTESLATLRGADSNASRSLPLSPALARKQQIKLEEDFKRVEANLDQTYSELRKYLRTS